MKKVILGIAVLLAGYSSVNAQAFDKSSKLITLGIGGAQYWNVGGYAGSYGGLYGYGWAPTSGEVSVQAEFGVHKYVGVGGFIGIGGGGWGVPGSNWGQLNIPIGALANFHFYQLIADKVSKDIHADKLDIYAGLNLGTGAGIWFADNKKVGSSALIWGGPQVGIRYYFKPNIAVNGELGYGKTFINGGITFKL